MDAKKSQRSAARATSHEANSQLDERTHTEQISDSIASRIRRSLAQNELSDSEKKVARTILARYPVSGLETTAVLAHSAGVSAPTVVRFAVTLGFSGYKQFQEVLRAELQERTESPLSLSVRHPLHELPANETLERAAKLYTTVVDHSFTGISEQELQRAWEMLANTRHRIWIFGGRFSHVLALYMRWHLRLLRPGTGVVESSNIELSDFLLSLRKGDICVVFDYRRYQRSTMELAQQAHERGARIILFTDIWLSPISSYADIVITAEVDAGGAFDSLVGAMAQVESVVTGVMGEIGEPAKKRLQAYEELGKDSVDAE